MGRLFDAIIIGGILFVLFTAGVFVFLRNRQREPERDLSAVPAHWFSYSREVSNGTEIGIQRVADRSREVLERRPRLVVRHTDPAYDEKYDREMEAAYRASVKADTYEIRR